MPPLQNNLESYQKYFQNGGEMGELIRSYDWTKTVIGHPKGWSQNLLCTIGIILGSKFPMFLFWGDELIQFYNDAYRLSLGDQGKHPKALGQKGKECWFEIWSTIKPLIDKVMAGEEATWEEDSLLPIFRNGHIEDVYWTFSYSRVIDSNGDIGGVLVTCFETTMKVRNQNSMNSTLFRLSESENRLNKLIVEAPVGIGLLKGRDHVIETANRKILQFWGKTDAVIGKPLEIALPELKDQPFLKILDNVFSTGKAYSSSQQTALLENDGLLKEYYFDFTYQPIQNENGITNSIIIIANDITEQVISKQVIEQSAQQFHQLADSIAQMVWVTDAKGMHQYYNKRWYDFTGCSFETAKGTGWNGVFHPDDRERAWEVWNQSLKTGEPYEIEYRLRNYKGEYIWVLGRASPTFGTDGIITKWFGTCTDINDQKLMLEKQDNFISTASHELKTPITVLKAYLQLINRAKDSSVVFSLIQKVNDSANKIIDLVDELLDVSKLNHGKIVLDKTVFTLSEMLTNCCDHLTIDNKYILKIEGEISLQVCADLKRVQQVVTNFVSNAIKYAPDSFEISAKIEKFVSFSRVSITDHGNGIAPENLSRLFERYFRADINGNKAGGLGLGLYICSEIIKEHGGEIGADSMINQGSTFWFTLPID